MLGKGIVLTTVALNQDTRPGSNLHEAPRPLTRDKYVPAGRLDEQT